MINKLKLKKGDEVIVITGKDKGKKGKILKVFPELRKLIVEGINMVTKHVKQSQNSQGGRLTKESKIDISNVMILDRKDNKPTKIGFKTLSDGKKVRFAKTNNETIE